MANVNCIIIEDEFPAMEILKGYLSGIPNWTVVAEFTNAVDAIAYLSHHQVDVIFLDIQLPRLSGIGFIKSLESPPLIVITTAYDEHAVEAFELTVFDYLLKPYPFERCLKTIHRINNHLQKSPPEVTDPEAGYLFVRENRENVKVEIAEIIYIESQKEYVKLFCADRAIKVRAGISKYEEMLGEDGFLRVHRSFLVSLSKVESFSNTQVTVGGKTIPIGRHYRKGVQGKFG